MHFSVQLSFLVILCTQVFTGSCGSGKKWALLIAGSKGWMNYRHQADICHAYQLLRAEGIPAENIITMMYDDVANSTSNPNKGVLINRPGGPNVYKGVVKDYTGKDLTVDNFLHVLKGDKEAVKGVGSGRVIESGPMDTIFVNIVDHGSEGTITINDNYLYADQLNNAIKYMKDNKRYSKILMYVETCHSGSMFDSIIGDQDHVYVMTAAAPDESSFVRYYSDDLNTYIGDAFSTIWMENMDKIRENLRSSYTTLFKQYKYVRTNVNMSHVMIYGDFRLGLDKVSVYMGDLHAHRQTEPPRGVSFVEELDVNRSGEEWISSDNLQEDLLTKKLKKTTNILEQSMIKRELKKIQDSRYAIDNAIDLTLQELAGEDLHLYYYLSSTKKSPTEDVFPCYRKVVEMFDKHCIKSHEHPYSTKHFHKFINICKKRIPLTKLPAVLKKACQRSLLSM